MRLLQDRGALRDPRTFGVPPPPPPAAVTRWPRPKPPEASPLAGRLARHAYRVSEVEVAAREAALASRWPLARLRTREAERLAGEAETAALLRDAVAALTGELRSANARIARLEQALEARGAHLLAGLLDRLLTERLDDVRGSVIEGRTALDGRVNALEASLDERFSWLDLDLDALEVRVRSAPAAAPSKPPDRSPEEPAG